MSLKDYSLCFMNSLKMLQKADDVHFVIAILKISYKIQIIIELRSKTYFQKI